MSCIFLVQDAGVEFVNFLNIYIELYLLYVFSLVTFELKITRIYILDFAIWGKFSLNVPSDLGRKVVLFIENVTC